MQVFGGDGAPLGHHQLLNGHLFAAEGRFFAPAADSQSRLCGLEKAGGRRTVPAPQSGSVRAKARAAAGVRGVAQPGRALGSGPRGRRFKSSRPDFVKTKDPRSRGGLLLSSRRVVGCYAPSGLGPEARPRPQMTCAVRRTASNLPTATAVGSRPDFVKTKDPRSRGGLLLSSRRVVGMYERLTCKEDLAQRHWLVATTQVPA